MLDLWMFLWGGGGSGVLRPMLINLGYWVNRLHTYSLIVAIITNASVGVVASCIFTTCRNNVAVFVNFSYFPHLCASYTSRNRSAWKVLCCAWAASPWTVWDWEIRHVLDNVCDRQGINWCALDNACNNTLCNLLSHPRDPQPSLPVRFGF